MKPLKPKQVEDFLKQYRNAEVVYSDDVRKDKTKIDQFVKSAGKIILIREKYDL